MDICNFFFGHAVSQYDQKGEPGKVYGDSRKGGQAIIMFILLYWKLEMGSVPDNNAFSLASAETSSAVFLFSSFSPL